MDKFEVILKAKGESIHVSFRPNNETEISTFSGVWLTGLAVQVFKGEVLYDYSYFLLIQIKERTNYIL